MANKSNKIKGFFNKINRTTKTIIEMLGMIAYGTLACFIGVVTGGWGFLLLIPLGIYCVYWLLSPKKSGQTHGPSGRSKKRKQKTPQNAQQGQSQNQNQKQTQQTTININNVLPPQYAPPTQAPSYQVNPPKQAPTSPVERTSTQVQQVMEDPAGIINDWKKLPSLANRHEFLNLLRAVIERAVRYAYHVERNQVVKYVKEKTLITLQGHGYFVNSDISWLWKCLEDYRDQGTVLKMDVTALPDTYLTQMLKISGDIVYSCLGRQGLS